MRWRQRSSFIVYKQGQTVAAERAGNFACAVTPGWHVLNGLVLHVRSRTSAGPSDMLLSCPVQLQGGTWWNTYQLLPGSRWRKTRPRCPGGKDLPARYQSSVTSSNELAMLSIKHKC